MKKILVIEDEPAMRANLEQILQLEEFRPVLAGDGLAGIEAARRELPDLILCDVLMPNMDGYAVLDALRKDDSTSRIPFRTPRPLVCLSNFTISFVGPEVLCPNLSSFNLVAY